MKVLKNMALLAFLALGLGIQGCSNSSSSNQAAQKESSKRISTPLPLVYANGDILDYLDLSRLEEVQGIKSAGLSVSTDGILGIGYWNAEQSVLGKDRYIAGRQKRVPTVKQLRDLYLEREEFNKTIEILQNNGLRKTSALWTGNPYWTSERPSGRDAFKCVLMGSGDLFESSPEHHNAFRAVAELP